MRIHTRRAQTILIENADIGSTLATLWTLLSRLKDISLPTWCSHPAQPGRMSKKQDDGGDDITFVVTTNPLSNSAANKKRVRSVAALKSWPERRKKTFEHSHGKNVGNQGGFVLDLPPPPFGPTPPNPAKKAKLGHREESPRPGTTTAGFSDPLSLHRQRLLDEEPLFEKCTRATSEFCNCTHCRAERRYHRQAAQLAPSQSRGAKRTADGSLKLPPPFNTDLARITPPATPGPSPLQMINNSRRQEPFNQYPVPYKPWFDHVLHHMMNVFAPRGWPSLKITNAEGRHWEWFMTQHALGEPALFYVRLLFATGDLVRLKCINADVTYWLQTQAVQAINEALSDPQRATSDALILAVGRIALHETLYGDRKAASTVHRPAQKRMIAMRGGMGALPFPELVKRLMRWADTVMSKLSGTERLLEDDEERPNFSTEQHVEVLEKWAPMEGRELSKKIKISDLLSPDQGSKPP